MGLRTLAVATAVGVGASLSYDVDTAERAVHYAAAAYCADDWIKDWNCDNCEKGLESQEVIYVGGVHNNRGFVGYDSNKDMTVLSFEGTDPLSIRDWIDDIETFKWQDPEYPQCDNCKVHAGFFESWTVLRDQAYDQIARVIKEHQPKNGILVTGHSLGAAIATHAALDLVVYGKTTLGADIPVTSYTFGEPRCGNNMFANYFHEKVPKYVRVVHENDIVPHLPTESMGFTHVPTEVWYHHKLPGGYKVCNGSGEDDSCSDGEIDISIPDHLEYLGLDMTTNYLGCKLNPLELEGPLEDVLELMI